MLRTIWHLISDLLSVLIVIGVLCAVGYGIKTLYHYETQALQNAQD